MRGDAQLTRARFAVVDYGAIAAVPARETERRPTTGDRTGIPWEMLPAEMGCGSGITCWRRLRDWQAAGVWDRLHRELLRRLHDADRIDWSRACVDSSSIAAKKGVRQPGRTRRIEAGPAPSAI